MGSVVSRLGSLTKPKAVDPELLMKGAVFHEQAGEIFVANSRPGERRPGAAKRRSGIVYLLGRLGPGKTLFAKRLAAHARDGLRRHEWWRRGAARPRRGDGHAQDVRLGRAVAERPFTVN